MYVYQTICVWIDNINKERRQIGGKKDMKKEILITLYENETKTKQNKVRIH